MKFFTSMLAVATLAFAAGCASTNNDSASMSAVSGTSCAASTGCCGGKEGCGSKKTEDMPSLGAVSNEKAGCCSSQKASACPMSAKQKEMPALSAVSNNKASCCASSCGKKTDN